MASSKDEESLVSERTAWADMLWSSYLTERDES